MGNQCTKVKERDGSRRDSTTLDDFDSIGETNTMSRMTQAGSSRCMEPSILSAEASTRTGATSIARLQPMTRKMIISPTEQYRDFDGEEMETSNTMLKSPTGEEDDDITSPKNIITSMNIEDAVSDFDGECDPAVQNDQSFGQQKLMASWLDDQVNVRLKKASITPADVDEARNAAKNNKKLIACSERVVTDQRKHVEPARAVVQQTKPSQNDAAPSVFAMMKRAAARRPI